MRLAGEPKSCCPPRTLLAAAIVWAVSGLAHPAAAGIATPGVLLQQAPAAGTLFVRVVDPSGAPAPGATVSLEGVVARMGQAPVEHNTDARGEAVFSGLEPGLYRVRVVLLGFLPMAPSTIQVGEGQQRATFRLALPRVEETVSVKASDSTGGRAGNAFSRVLTPLEIAALPDDPVALEEVLRQIAGPGATITVDGFRRGMLPPKSAIALITIKWADLSAETHAQSNVVVEIITKPGSNTFDGTLTMSAQPSAWRAADPFSGRATASESVGGLYISGPVWRHRTSFMAYVRGTRTAESAAVTAALPESWPAGPPVLDVTQTEWDADWQVTHQFSPKVFLRIGGTLHQATGRNMGVGGLDLPERAYDSDQTDHTERVSLFSGRDAGFFNQFRASVRTQHSLSAPVSDAAAIAVAGAFRAGGAQRRGRQNTSEWAIEDDLDLAHGRHAVRVGLSVERQAVRNAEWTNPGGTFSFASLGDYERGRPVSFSQRIGDPAFSCSQTRAGAYIQDNIRLREGVAVGAGLRVEAATGPGGRPSAAPRVRVAWSPRKRIGTTLKGGVGWYYDWVGADLQAQVLRVDGQRQFDLIILDPGYPDPFAGGDARTLPRSRAQFAANLALPRTLRMAVGLEHKAGSTTWELSYDDTRAGNRLQGWNLNAPVTDGIRPYPDLGNVTQLGSTGWSRLRSVRVQARATMPPRTIVNALYEIRWSRNDSDGPFTLPSDNRNPAADRGPGSDDVRHRIGVYLLMPVTPALILSAFAMVASSTPYNVTTGQDDNGDTVINDRPAGVSRNSSRGAPSATVDARLMWRLLAKVAPAATGGGPGAVGKSPVSLVLYVAARNVLNRTNLAGYSGVIGSPLFGRPTGAQAKRRLEVGLTLGF